MSDTVSASDRALIEQHIASKGVTKVPRGASSWDPLEPGDPKAGLAAWYANRSRGRRIRKAERKGKS